MTISCLLIGPYDYFGFGFYETQLKSALYIASSQIKNFFPLSVQTKNLK